jgi:hypothetical protein
MFLLLCSGCVIQPAGYYANMVAYEPVRSPVQIDASASIEVVDTLSPDTQRALRNYLGHSDAIIANYVGNVEHTIRNDLVTSGLFARIANNDGTKPDYQVKVHCEELYPGDFRVRITLTTTETVTGQQDSSHTRETSVGKNVTRYKLAGVLPGLMAELKADLVEDLTQKARRQQEQVARDEADFFTSASLSKLLASTDGTEFLARSRNRAIVAAKNQQLPAILRERKSDELSALTVKIEQTILDLNHECEAAKDQAQQTVASGDTPEASVRGGRGSAGPATTGLNELRGLAICYRERIELLKPILAALKEEIANRSR